MAAQVQCQAIAVRLWQEPVGLLVECALHPRAPDPCTRTSQPSPTPSRSYPTSRTHTRTAYMKHAHGMMVPDALPTCCRYQRDSGQRTLKLNLTDGKARLAVP